MTEAPCDIARRRIDEFYESSIAPPDWALLLRHLRTCDACGQHFQGARDLARAVAVDAGPNELTSVESKRLRGIIERRAETRERRAATWRSRNVVLGAFVTLAAAAAVVAVLHGRSTTDGFAERGALDSTAGFDLLCVPESPNGATTSVSHSAGICPAGNYLKPIVSSHKPTQVSVVALDRSLSPRLIAHALVGSATPVPVDGNVQVRAGEDLTFVAVFSDHPATDSVVRAAVEQLRLNKQSADTLKALPIVDGRQLVIRIRATPAQDP